MIRRSSSNIKNEKNLFNVGYFLLKSLKIKFTDRGLSEKLLDHLDYPSLLALKDALYDYGIESAAIRRGQHKYDMFQTPFICAIQQPDWANSRFTLVINVQSNGIKCLDPITNKEKLVSLEEFEKIDKNIILLLDISAAKDEINLLENKRKQLRGLLLKTTPILLLVAFFLTAIGYMLTGSQNILSLYGIAFVLSSFFGLMVSSLLLWHEIDAHNPFIKEVCGGKTKKMNCGAVLSSPTSSVFGIKWSVLGFSFFATFFTTQIIFPASAHFILLWSALSLLVSPYILFSLYYQGNVIKQWCLLCLAVQALLTINAVLSYSFLWNTVIGFKDIEIYNLVTTLFLGCFFLVTTYISIPLIKSANDSKNFEKKWKNLKLKPEVFQAMLNNSEKISTSADNLGILLGNSEAGNEIIKVCNPYCGPCSKSHPELNHILKMNSDVKIRIIFAASGEESDIKTLPIAHLLAIQDYSSQVIVNQALDEWYLSPIKDYQAFAQKYPMNIELKQQMKKIIAMRDWCTEMKIRATPTIYVNGRELPTGYHLSELKNFF